MDDVLAYFESLINYAQTNGSKLNRASQQALAQLIAQFQELIVEMNEKGQTEQITPSAPSNDAQLLWMLSGQQPQAFISYLRTFSTADTQELLANPAQLNATIDQLNRMMPPGELPVIDGIPHADLNSSNVWGASYNPKNGHMRIRFQGGSEYEYSGIPENIFKAFIKGNAAAKTTGKNKFGQWWTGKNPSLGAALHQYIKRGNFSYVRLR